MTEEEWLACGDPGEMLEALRGKVSAHRLWRFAALCWRRGARFLEDEASCRGVEALEALADGVAIDDRCLRFTEEGEFLINLRDVPYGIGINQAPEFAAVAARNSVEAVAMAEAGEAGDPYLSLWARIVGDDHATAQAPGAADGLSAALRSYSPLILEFFGNPFRPLSFSPDWRTSTAIALAQQMYDSRDFSAMPILADALQDAGCDNADILDHCRGPEPHVRGCWVVDLVLSKE
jgi:hypothetical protein